MSRIDKMSMREILSELSLNLTAENMNFVTRFCPEMIDELKETTKLGQEKGNTSKITKIVGEAVGDIFVKYEDKLDKAKLVLLTVYNSQRMIEEEELEENVRTILKKCVRVGLRMLGDKEVIAVVPINIKDDEEQKGLVLLNSQELSRMIKNGTKMSKISNITKKKKERLDNLNKREAIRNIVQLLRFEDLEHICSSSEIANMLVYQISFNGLEKYIKAHPDKKIRLKNGEMPEDFENVFERSFECLVAKTEAIMQNCKYIDIDKMLLVCAYRFMEMIENSLESDIKIANVEDETGEISQINDSNQTLNILYSLLKNIYDEVEKDTRIAYVYDYEISYSAEELERDLRRFSDGKYIKRSETEKLKERILSGEITLVKANQDELALISVTEEEFLTLIKNSEDNSIYFIERGIIDGDNIEAFLGTIEKCSVRLFRAIYEKEIINTEQIIELLKTGIIDVESIATIQNDEILEGINSHVKETIKQLNDKLFKEEQEQTALDMQEFIRYITLYKMLSIMDKTEEERLEEAFKLISSFEDSIDSETLERLYQYGLIPLESAVDWGVNLTDMLSNNNIKPTDLKELYAKGIIKLDDIKRVIRQTNLPYDEKMDLIFSTFDGDSQEEKDLRNELINLLESVDEYKEKSKGTKKLKPVDPKVKSFEYVTDPLERWKVFSAIDKEGSKKILSHNMEVRDGHRVFFFPNYGEVLIEKMYEKRYGEIDWAYASATYVMKIETFFKFAHEIIIEGAINRTFLGELYKSDDVFRQIHGPKWAEHILKHFGIIKGVQNEKHTEEEIKRIYEIAEGVKKSRRLRE